MTENIWSTFYCILIVSFASVIPGSIDHLNAKPKDFMKQLLPGNVVQELELEVKEISRL